VQAIGPTQHQGRAKRPLERSETPADRRVLDASARAAPESERD
jgi:hypothetical protein